MRKTSQNESIQLAEKIANFIKKLAPKWGENQSSKERWKHKKEWLGEKLKLVDLNSKCYPKLNLQSARKKKEEEKNVKHR